MFRLYVFILVAFSTISFGALNTWSVPNTVLAPGEGIFLDDMAMSGDTAIIAFRNLALDLFTIFTTDHGQTWSVPAIVDAGVNDRSSIAINGNGSVVICAYPKFPNISTKSSIDLGQIWSDPTDINNANKPSVTVNSAGDKAYLGYKNTSDNNTYVSLSTNHGTDWNPPVPIDTGARVTVATSSLGDKVYFISNTGSVLNSYFSSNSGASWSTATQVTTNAGGDFSFSISSDGEKAFAAWDDRSLHSFSSYGTNHGTTWQPSGSPASFAGDNVNIIVNNPGTIALLTGRNAGNLFSYYTPDNGANWSAMSEAGGVQVGGVSLLGMNTLGTLGLRVWFNSVTNTLYSSFSDFSPPSPPAPTVTFNVVGNQSHQSGLFEVDIVNTLSWNSIPSAESYKVKNGQLEILFDGIANNFYEHSIKNGVSSTYFVSYVVGGVESTPVEVTLP